MENIENLGSYLKNIREERKIPIAQIAQELKSRLEFIQAIESNEFDKLPAPTYVKGFLRSYAKYLDLDPDQILAIYNKNYQKQSEQILILKGKEIPRIGLKIGKFKLLLWGPIAIIIVLIIVLGATWLFRSIKPRDIEKNAVKSTPATPVLAKTTPLPLTAPINTPIQLTAQTTDNVWLRVHCDGKLIFEGILAKGEEKQWQANKEFKLRVGNPGELNLILNGNRLGTIAPYGPVNVVINEKGIKTEK